MYLLYFGDIPNLVSCAFSTIPIFPLFKSQNFLFTCIYFFKTSLFLFPRTHTLRQYTNYILSRSPSQKVQHNHSVRSRNKSDCHFMYNVHISTYTYYKPILPNYLIGSRGDSQGPPSPSYTHISEKLGLGIPGWVCGCITELPLPVGSSYRLQK